MGEVSRREVLEGAGEGASYKPASGFWAIGALKPLATTGKLGWGLGGGAS